MTDITVALEINPTGTPETLTSRSYTESCAPMWVEACADLATFDGLKAVHILGNLQSAVTDMTDHPEVYTTLDPEDETGDSEGCLAFLNGLVDDVCAHPKATVRVT